jgi:hypothetical protein
MPFQLAAFNRQIARLGRAGGENHGVKFLQQFFRRIIFSDFGVADKFHAFFFQQRQAAQHDFFFVELHVGDAIHEQAAGTVGAFKHGDESWPALFNCAAAESPAGPEPTRRLFCRCASSAVRA